MYLSQEYQNYAQKRYTQALREHKKLGSRIRKTVSPKNKDELNTYRRRCKFNRMMINSYSSKLVACVDFIKGEKKRPTAYEIVEAEAMANKLNLWEPCDEPVTLYPKWKANNNDNAIKRYVCEFGEENKLRQHFVGIILGFSANTNSNVQYMRRGGGRDKAARKVVDHFRHGFTSVTEIDITNAYRSFDECKFHEFFALPKKVCQNTIISAGLNISLEEQFWKRLWSDLTTPFSLEDSTYDLAEVLSSEDPLEVLASVDDDWRRARRGVIEGSHISPLLFEMLNEYVLERIPNSARAVTYADNMLLMTRSSSETEELERNLREVLKKHPLGVLYANHPPDWVQSDYKNFFFLGYKFKPVGTDLKILAPENVMKKAKRKIANLYEYLFGDAPYLEKVKVLTDFVKDFHDHFSGFRGRDGHGDEMGMHFKAVTKKALEAGIKAEDLPKQLQGYANAMALPFIAKNAEKYHEKRKKRLAIKQNRDLNIMSELDWKNSAEFTDNPEWEET